MPRNGSGTMSLVHDWEDDKTNGIKILASRMMAQQNDIADELTNSIDKDGQTIWTGNQDAGDQKITNYGQTSVPNARDDVPFLGQLQDQAGIYVAASGVNDIGIAPIPAFDSYTDGKKVAFKAAANNTGAMTINVSALGAKSIQKLGGTALEAADIRSGGQYEITFNAVSDTFELINAFPGAGISELHTFFLATS